MGRGEFMALNLRMKNEKKRREAPAALEPNFCSRCRWMKVDGSDLKDSTKWVCMKRRYTEQDFLTGEEKTVIPLCLVVRGTVEAHCRYYDPDPWKGGRP